MRRNVMDGEGQGSGGNPALVSPSSGRMHILRQHESTLVREDGNRVARSIEGFLDSIALKPAPEAGADFWRCWPSEPRLDVPYPVHPHGDPVDQDVELRDLGVTFGMYGLDGPNV